MIRIITKRKNPNLKGEEFIDDHFINLLFEALVYNHPPKFQFALTYKNIGYEDCEDCVIDGSGVDYRACTCENYLDDYNIDYHGSEHTKSNLINGVKKQFKYLSFPQLVKFKTRLINIDYSNKNDSFNYVSPASIRIYQDDVKSIIKEINNVISKRK